MTNGVKSGYALLVESRLKQTRAQRQAIILEMLYPTGIDEHGNVIELTPLITEAQAAELLNMVELKNPDLEEDKND